MRVLFIRHAIALEREAFTGDDLLRPLSDEGKTKAAKTFAGYAAFFDKPELIITSEAIRAKETAELLSVAFGGVKTQVSALLNPGAGYAELKKLLTTLDNKLESVAFVGHEPDFSTMIGHAVTGGGLLYMGMKKAGCAEVELGREGRGELKCLLTPRQGAKCKGKHV